MRNYFIIILLLLYVACKKKTVEEKNPFTSTVASTDSSSAKVPLTANFSSIYTNIFKPQCAYSPCHDGNPANSFQPDFRTYESAYLTMVNHPTKRIELDKNCKTIVKPRQIGYSMLNVRIINTLGARMPSGRDSLKAAEIKAIQGWIKAGALKD
jgi:hypothetical protein